MALSSRRRRLRHLAGPARRGDLRCFRFMGWGGFRLASTTRTSCTAVRLMRITPARFTMRSDEPDPLGTDSAVSPGSTACKPSRTVLPDDTAEPDTPPDRLCCVTRGYGLQASWTVTRSLFRQMRLSRTSSSMDSISRGGFRPSGLLGVEPGTEPASVADRVSVKIDPPRDPRPTRRVSARGGDVRPSATRSYDPSKWRPQWRRSHRSACR